VFLHRFLLGEPPGMDVDHINGNTLDNRLENLRAISHAENTRNRKGPRRGSRSGVKGVSWSGGVWRVQARTPLGVRLLAEFKSIEDAGFLARAWRAFFYPSSLEARELRPSSDDFERARETVAHFARKIGVEMPVQR